MRQVLAVLLTYRLAGEGGEDFEPWAECEERKCVRNRKEDTLSSTGSQDVRCRQVEDSEKLLISGDEEDRNPGVLFGAPPRQF